MSALNKTGEFQFSGQSLFDRICQEIYLSGYSLCYEGFPFDFALNLHQELHHISQQKFIHAGIGREDNFILNQFIRTDKIHWIEADTPIQKQWLDWCTQLMTHLNRKLFLGLFAFETHYAYYSKGDFYKRHYDAFRGEKNRVLTMVLYLNPTWEEEDGGELILYQQDDDLVGTKIYPQFGTLAIFLSEEFPHEVKPTQKDRYSITCWFRVNQENPLQFL